MWDTTFEGLSSKLDDGVAARFRNGCFMSTRFLVFCAIFGFTSTIFATDSKESDGDQAKRLVQAALQSEITGTAQEREELVKQASALQSQDPSVHWQLGQVKIGNVWRDYTSLVDQSKKSKVLEEYRVLRDSSQPTLASQIQVTTFCLKHGLKEQAKSHWSAILELDPDNANARKQMGFVRLGGRWLLSNEIESERRSSTKIAENLRKNLPGLRSIGEDLINLRITSTEATAKICVDASIYSIPGWELCLSSDNSRGASAVVGALETLSAPEASLSLARHAVWANDSKVRESAILALAYRDQHSFIPAMLAELQGPWIASRQWAYDSFNRLIIRYSLVADGQDRQSLQVMDNIYFLQGNPYLAALTANSQASQSTSQNERIRRNENALIETHNAQIIHVLGRVTDQNGLTSPQDWWEWWDAKNEVYSSSEKPILTSYMFRTSEARAPLSLSSSSENSDGRESRDKYKKDCLASGTPILTQRGPVNVERVRIGDLVLSKHPETGEVRFSPVLRTTIREPEPLIRIALEGESNRAIRASGGHPFWVSGKGWLKARELTPGMRLHGLEQFSEVIGVEEETKPTRTYNLVVADFHSYFIGIGGVLSHDNSVIEPVRCLVPGLNLQ